MSLKKTLSVNIAANWVGMFVNAVVGIVLIPYILTRVGVTKYGVWILMAGLLSYAAILQSAFSLAINRFVARYRSDIGQVNKYFASTLYVTAGISLCVLLLSFVVSLFLNNVFSIPTYLEREARYTCVLVGLNVSILAIQGTVTGLLSGYQLYVRTNCIMIFGLLLRAVFVWFGLWESQSIVVLQLCYCSATLLATITAVFVAVGSIPGLRFFARTEWDRTKTILSYAKHSLARSGSDLTMYSSLLLIVGWLGTPQDVTLYSLAMKIPQIIRGFLTSAQAVFLPTFSTLFAAEGTKNIVRIVRKAMRLNAMLTFAMIVLVAAYTEPLLKFWLGNNFQIEMVGVMKILLLSIVARGVFEIWMPALVAMGILRGLTISAILTCVCAIVLTVVFCSYVSSYYAAAFALLIVLTIRSGIWLPVYGFSRLGLQWPSHLQEILFRPVVALAASVLLLIGFFHLVPVSTKPVELLFHGALSAVAVGVLFILIGVPTETVRYTRMFLHRS